MIVPGFIKKPIKAVFHRSVLLNLALRRQEFQYVFILAHMRSGSTLLSHILTTHPAFVGAGETHTTYRTPDDLVRLAPRTCELLREFNLHGTYLVDKITMDQYLSDDVLSSLPIQKCVILIREPEGTLKSLMDRFKWNEKIALDHYTSRLQTLTRYGRVLQERALFVRYGDLVDHAKEALSALTVFFSVEPPFSEDYEKTRATGKMGDPSENILRGRIFRTPGHELSISSEVMGEATRAFHKCQLELQTTRVYRAVSE
jgi:hypothetical protein